MPSQDRSFSMRRELENKTITPAMTDRRDKLQALLQHNGMDLRDDSRLAHNYVVNGGDVHMVAHELLCTNFLYTHTNYDRLCQDGLRYLADEMKRMYNLPWKQTWAIVREFGVPAMKFYALAEAGATIPFFQLSANGDACDASAPVSR